MERIIRKESVLVISNNAELAEITRKAIGEMAVVEYACQCHRAKQGTLW